MDKRVKQKLLDRMNKVTKNSLGIILGNYPGSKAYVPEAFCDIMKSPNKEYNIFGNNFYYNNRIISNENSKNEEKDFDKKDKKYEKRNTG